MSVRAALKELRLELARLGIPATRVEIWMPQPDADRVHGELRPTMGRSGALRSMVQVEGFLLYGSADLPDHAGCMTEYADA